MGDDARFGDLRAHLERPPERPTAYSYASDKAFKAEQDAWWTDLLTLLDSFDAQDALAEEVLPYVRERSSFRSIQTKHLPRTLELDDSAQRSKRIGLRERFFSGEEVGWAELVESVTLAFRDDSDAAIVGRFGDRPNDVALFKGIPPDNALEKVDVELMAHFYLPVMAKLFEDTNLAHVERLSVDLWGATLDACHSEGAEVAMDELAFNDPLASKLTSLSMPDNALGDGAFRALCASPYLPGIPALWLGEFQGERGNLFTDEALFALAESPLLADLVLLDINRNDGIGPDGLRALLESPHVLALEDLRLSLTGIGEEGVRMLAQWPGGARLRVLHAIVSNVSDEALELPRPSPPLAGCEVEC